VERIPIVTDAPQLRETLPENAFRTLSRWADGKTSLRQMARYLNRDLLTVAKAIYPYIQQGWIQLLMANVPEVTNLRQWDFPGINPVRRVICVDDDVAIGKTVEYMLQARGYEVTTIQNPLKALSQVFQIKPDLIICDLVMPKLDGYELCGMLRQSTIFRLTPIIMLTGRDGFIDRVRARMVGATDYLTKPFGASELLMLLEKYIGPGDLRQGRMDNSVTEVVDRSREATDVTESASA
jgi:twitching motility two-component system response regulator PilG